MGAQLPCRMPLRLPRNPTFHGRTRELEELDKHCLLPPNRQTTDGDQGCRQCAVFGMGGVGKTELVIEWAYRQMLSFEAVFWVDAADASQLASSYDKILPALTLQPLAPGSSEDSDMVARREATKMWFARAKTPWFLIFDNADSIELLPAYWPTGSVGSVVVTSRDPSSKRSLDLWGGFGTLSLHLEPFPETEAADFVQKLTGCADTPDERQACLDMSRQLGCLPLAIMGMSHVIHRRQWSVRRTVARCEEDGGYRHLWATLAPGAPEIHRYGKAMAAALGLDELDANALELLQLLSMLGPDRIPERLIGEKDGFWDSMATLLSSSLIKWDGGGEELTIHRVIAEEVRARMTDETLHRNFREAIRLFQQAWPADRFEKRHSASLFPAYESTVFWHIEHIHKIYKAHRMECSKAGHDGSDLELVGLCRAGAA